MTQSELDYRDLINRIAGAMIAFLILFTLLHNVAFDTAYHLSKILTPKATTVAGSLLESFAYLFSFIIPVFVFRWLSRKKKHPTKPMAMIPVIPKTAPLLIASGVAITMCFAYLNSVFLQIVGQSNGFSVYDEYAIGSVEGFEYVLLFISIAIVPAFCEEFLFRGMILRNLMPYGKSTAIIVSSLLFALMHQNQAQFLYTFFSGVILALVCVETGSIWCSVFIHLFNNGFSVFSEIISVQLGKDAASYVISIMDGIVCVAGLISIIALVRLYEKRREDDKRRLDGGFFGRRFEQSYSYAPIYIDTGSKISLFCTPLMLIFCVLSVINSF